MRLTRMVAGMRVYYLSVYLLISIGQLSYQNSFHVHRTKTTIKMLRFILQQGLTMQPLLWADSW